MKHYYATGNSGGGTGAYAFLSEKERDEFVSFNKHFDQKSPLSRNQARLYSKEAILLVDGRTEADGYGVKTIIL